jgi:hypothetical protein
LLLPQEKKPGDLPAPLAISRPEYSFSGSYVVSGSTLKYRCEIILKDSEIKPAQFLQWNNDIDQLEEFYNQQIVLKKTK